MDFVSLPQISDRDLTPGQVNVRNNAPFKVYKKLTNPHKLKREIAA
jgi:hypothetical protein